VSNYIPRSISAFVLNGVLITISISIPLAAIFLPFLLNYGLVEFVGVLVRPIMRPLFKLPGRSAVILVSALLGNFSVAHIAVDGQYHKGHMTERESLAICTGFCSSSIAFMMVLATNAGIMDGYWNAYVWSSFLIIILITLIGVRFPPITSIADTYAPGITPQPEREYRKNLMRNALAEGLGVAQSADNPVIGIAQILKATVGILAAIIMGAGFSTSAGMLLYLFTPIFEWLGVIFRPIMWLVQMPASEVVTASTGAAFSLLEVTIPSMLVMAGEWSYHIRYMMAVVPITSVIFLGSFVPSLISTNLPVKFWHLMVIWVQRMILSVLFSGLFALLLFGMPG
jgi:nucleoside recognition membrane protein YjiH